MTALDLDAAFRDRFLAACHAAADIKGESTDPTRIWADGGRCMEPVVGPWWESTHPSDPDLNPDLTEREQLDRADREAHR